MPNFNYQGFFSSTLSSLQEDGSYRSFLELRRIAGKFPHAEALINGELRSIIVWCSNDYLGMGQHPAVLKAMHDAIDEFGAGAGGTRNISGTHNLIISLEKELAAHTSKEAALVFSSGYVANETTLCALSRSMPGCTVFSDANNHDSIIQGIRHGKAKKAIFRHNDLSHLEELLAASDRDAPKLIVFESVYSMDGDNAPIGAICDLAERYNALTFIDETHAVGLYGKYGGGLSEESGMATRLDIIQGGLGKAFGVMGGFISASKALIDYVRSFGNGFIFTTSIPPAVAAGARAALHQIRKGQKERETLRQNASFLKTSLNRTGIPMLPSTTHIVPVMIGDPIKCRKASNLLLERFGIYIQPINFPTVPKGSERFRITPSAIHTHGMMINLIEALDKIWSQMRLPRSTSAATCSEEISLEAPPRSDNHASIHQDKSPCTFE